jgi:hypothetical protein
LTHSLYIGCSNIQRHVPGERNAVAIEWFSPMFAGASQEKMDSRRFLSFWSTEEV